MTQPIKSIFSPKTVSAIDLIRISRKGLTVNNVADISDYTKIPLETLLSTVSIPADHLNEANKLSKSSSSHLLLISNVYAKGYRIFKNKTAFYEWMNQKNTHLSDEIPFDLLDTAMGIEMIKKALEKAQKPTTGISALRGKVTPMTEEQIDTQLQQLKAEWERDFF